VVAVTIAAEVAPTSAYPSLFDHPTTVDPTTGYLINFNQTPDPIGTRIDPMVPATMRGIPMGKKSPCAGNRPDDTSVLMPLIEPVRSFRICFDSNHSSTASLLVSISQSYAPREFAKLVRALSAPDRWWGGACTSEALAMPDVYAQTESGHWWWVDTPQDGCKQSFVPMNILQAHQPRD
jgi:hypothetical protein